MLKRIVAFRLTTADLDGLGRFYAEGIGFTFKGRANIQTAEMARLGLNGGGVRMSLSLGDQHLDLDRFEQSGRPYPEDTNAADLDFQHFAIVVGDIVSAYARVLAHGAAPISVRGPVKLPPSAGGVTAVKFRDPEGHPLEFLQFASPAPKAWVDDLRTSDALGIDHSAISVADADVSAKFYEGHGLSLGRRTLNQGTTQANLDGLPTPVVDIVPMTPAVSAPHLELLGYRTPRGRPARASSPNDIAATRILWASDQDGLLTDPDGHRHLLQNSV